VNTLLQPPMVDILQPSIEASEIFITPGMQETEDFRPLPVRDLAVGWEVPFDIYLKIKKKGEEQPQFVKGCARGEVFREEWSQKLLELQIPCVYVSLAEMDRVLQYLHHNLEMLLADENQSDMEKSLRVCDATHMWTLNFFSSEKGRIGEQTKLALNFLDSLFKEIKSDHYNIFYLMEIRRHSYRLYNHCLNVSLLGMAFTSYLEWDREDIQGFGFGALIHDLGLIHLPRDILEKQGPLTPEEMALVRRHPLDGYHMMQDLTYRRRETLQMVLQHHENGDGSGYSRGLRIKAIHPWARILRILDSYEAMTAKRPWRPAMEPKEALWTMRTDWEKGKLFDHNYLMAFMKFLAGG
jgi:HD-GYP domain-containing protein (c-di-GMP phosphodiesterase class II)